ncbi:MAG: IPTL-CTERM sorting domain-containing protein [Candidatus Krumholzibacteriia bacterium]
MKPFRGTRLSRSAPSVAVAAFASGLGLLAMGDPAPADRPNLGPGESNWAPSAELDPLVLTTTDLSVLTPQDLVDALVGVGATTSNVSFTGASIAAGTFTGGTGIIGFESGIMLGSGNIASIPGPNMSDNTTTSNGVPGDPDLDVLLGPPFTTFDATVLEFDFECTGVQTIQFQYVFTSEEYNEWVFTDFNDVFGFFLNGANIAIVPGDVVPVAIDNVNCGNPLLPPTGGNNCNLYINNDVDDGGGAINTEMDGLTLVFTATAHLNPGLNHIKLAIADAGDTGLDSNVFLQGGSFACQAPTGACCDESAGSCADDVLEVDCQGPSDVWSVGLTCSQVNCGQSPPPIPTVSEWGVVVMGLLLSTAATIVLRRRRAMTRHATD